MCLAPPMTNRANNMAPAIDATKITQWIDMNVPVTLARMSVTYALPPNQPARRFSARYTTELIAGSRSSMKQ